MSSFLPSTLAREKAKKNSDANIITSNKGSEFLELDLTKSWSLVKDQTTTKFPPWKPVKYTIDTERGDNDLASTYQTSQNKLYLYDGLPTKNVSIDLPSTLLVYDIEKKHWSIERVYPQTDSERPLRFSRGTSVEVPDASGKSFYIGGARMYQNASIRTGKSWYYPVKQQVVGMAVRNGEFDKNFEEMARARKTIGAAVTWIPYGEEGSLIMIGGMGEEDDRTKSPDASGKVLVDQAPDPSAMHIQETTGQGPWERMGACAVSAYDNQTDTTQVFLYGGGSGSRLFGMDDKAFMGDLFVLQLPSFKWFAYNYKANVPAARTRHTCHVVNNRQMLILGGSRNDTLSTDEKVKDTCTWDEMSVLDMSLLEWQWEYRPITAPYTIPDDVKKNSLFQGKIIREPAVGWSTPGLQALFQVNNEKVVKKAEDKIAGLKKPVFIGIVSGAGCFLALLVVFGIFLCRRRKQSNKRIVAANSAAWHLAPQDMTMISPGASPVPSYQPYDPDLAVSQSHDKELYPSPAPVGGFVGGPALPAEMPSNNALGRVEMAGTPPRQQDMTTALQEVDTLLWVHTLKYQALPASRGVMTPQSEVEHLSLDANANLSAGLAGVAHVKSSAGFTFTEGNLGEASAAAVSTPAPAPANPTQ
ncbi:hypothetical protein L873DRAFT_1933330 [Choiromyces venosus 120613-1]|uniref:Galactose oxidase n=1 Tax=Choiromyces venosus 120613-1 TaxID=1336337 RepID=A0A3N4K5C7_9PEZI|nr:hypothetical protein L873DRAFT_1933330 [Choiromyces venosus 120613-1]